MVISFFFCSARPHVKTNREDKRGRKYEVESGARTRGVLSALGPTWLWRVSVRDGAGPSPSD